MTIASRVTSMTAWPCSRERRRTARGAISSMRRILTGLNVREVQEPVLIAGEFDEARLVECEELGLTLAAGLEAGVF